MFIVDNEITITWLLDPTDTPLLAVDFDIKVVNSGLGITYTDDNIVNYIAPTAEFAGSIQYLFTPLQQGRYQIYLTCGVALAYLILDKKDFWVFCEAPDSAPVIEVLDAPSIIPVTCPILILDITKLVEPNPLKELNIAAENNNPGGAWVSTDGLHFFVSRSSQEFMWQYNMTTPFDVSTASLFQSYAYDEVGGSPSMRFIMWREDGLKFWISTATTIFGYTLTTAWDVSTAAPDNNSYNLDADVGPFTGAPAIGNAGAFKFDGTELFVMWQNPTGIARWTLSTPWDVSTLVFQDQTADIFSAQGFPFTAYISPDGFHVVVDDAAGSRSLYQYDLSIAWDMTTLSYANKAWDYNTLMPSMAGTPQGMHIASNYSMVIFAENAGGSGDTIVQADFT